MTTEGSKLPRRRTTPSFKGLSASSETSSRIKSRNKSTNTLHEVALRRELWRRGLRYRADVKTLPGRPDIVFSRARVIVFCDGDFWHGRDWETLKAKLSHRANADYWIAKIGTNMQRDRRVDAELIALGWHVIRLWETDIKADVIGCADIVEAKVQSQLRAIE